MFVGDNATKSRQGRDNSYGICLQNEMRTRNPALQNHDMDHTDDYDNKKPWTWGNEAVLHDVAEAGRGYMANRESKRILPFLSIVITVMLEGCTGRRI